MKWLIFLATYIFFASQSFAATATLVRSSSSDQLWKIPSATGTFIALTKKANGKSFSLAGVENEKLIKRVESDKVKMLSMMGISKWVVSKREFQSGKDHKALLLSGSYEDRKGVKVHFVEKHHFTKEVTTQALLTSPSSSLSEFGALLDEKLSMFIKEGAK